MPSGTTSPPLLDLTRVTVMRGERAALQDLTLRITAENLSSLFGVTVRLGRQDGYFHVY